MSENRRKMLVRVAPVALLLVVGASVLGWSLLSDDSSTDLQTATDTSTSTTATEQNPTTTTSTQRSATSTTAALVVPAETTTSAVLGTSTTADPSTSTTTDTAPASTSTSTEAEPTTTSSTTTTVTPTTATPTTAAPTTAAPTTTVAPTTTTTAPANPYPPQNDAYRLAFRDEMSSPSFDWELDGGRQWQWYFPCGNLTENGLQPMVVLENNGDRAMKIHREYIGADGFTLGRDLHVPTGSSLKLRGLNVLWPEYSDQQYPYAAGMMSSRGLHTQTFGYWETRMRISSVSQGQHWAIWLVNADGTWPLEIDILETLVGSDRNASQFQTNVHWDTGGGTKSDTGRVHQFPGAADGWYTVGLEWTPDEINWFLDGELIRTVAAAKLVGHVDQPQDMVLQITPEIGGHWPGPVNDQTRWPMELEVDYVRIYAHDTHTSSTGTTRFAQRCGQG